MFFFILIGLVILATLLSLLGTKQGWFDTYYGGRYVPDAADYIANAVRTLLGAGIVASILFGFVGILVATDVETPAERDTYELRALVTENENTSGFYFLAIVGGGSSSEDLELRYIWKDSDGALIMDEADPDLVRIYEEDDLKTPTRVIQHYGGVVEGYAPWYIEGWITTEEFHIPTGTITSEIEVDLK